MPRGLGRLSFLPRRRRDATERVAPAPARPIDPDAAPVGPPLLLPAAIIRQILFEATELTPAWALPRATTTSAIVSAPAPPAPVAADSLAAIESEAKPAAKRTRRSASGTVPKAARSRSNTSSTAGAGPAPDAAPTTRRGRGTKRAG
jgi:hypothetical protein